MPAAGSGQGVLERAYTRHRDLGRKLAVLTGPALSSQCRGYMKDQALEIVGKPTTPIATPAPALLQPGVRARRQMRARQSLADVVVLIVPLSACRLC